MAMDALDAADDESIKLIVTDDTGDIEAASSTLLQQREQQTPHNKWTWEKIWAEVV